jgi:hypothetical protein
MAQAANNQNNVPYYSTVFCVDKPLYSVGCPFFVLSVGTKCETMLMTYHIWTKILVFTNDLT